jgi:hypothetical protein
MSDLVGKKFVFEDGQSIEVIQIKERDEGVKLVTYVIHSGPGIPRKLVMDHTEFMDTFGHLFE